MNRLKDTHRTSDGASADNAIGDANVSVLVWDFPTRFFHWVLVLLFAFSWWTERADWVALHKLSGFSLAALLTFRIFWGFFGATTSRFSDFLRGPRDVLRYLRGRIPTAAGHNPIGGWSILAMLLMLAVQIVLGLFSTDEFAMDSAPLASYVSFDTGRLAARLHGMMFDALLAVIGLHVSAVLFHLASGSNLFLPMLTGRKRLERTVRIPAMASRWSLIAGVVLAAAVLGCLWRLDAAQP